MTDATRFFACVAATAVVGGFAIATGSIFEVIWAAVLLACAVLLGIDLVRRRP